MSRLFRGAAILLLAAFLVDPATAQHVPEDYPGMPTEDKRERHEREMTERFRTVLSRMYTSTSFVAKPSSRGLFDPAAYQAAAGLRFHSGDALHATFEVRMYGPADGIRGRLPGEDPSEQHTLLASTLSYDLSLNRFTDHPLLKDRVVVGLGGGVVYGEHQMLTFELTPKYVIPINDYWSLPIGLNLSTAMIHGAGESIQTSFVGLHMGVRLYFGQREYLE